MADYLTPEQRAERLLVVRSQGQTHRLYILEPHRNGVGFSLLGPVGEVELAAARAIIAAEIRAAVEAALISARCPNCGAGRQNMANKAYVRYACGTVSRGGAIESVSLGCTRRQQSRRETAKAAKEKT